MVLLVFSEFMNVFPIFLCREFFDFHLDSDCSEDTRRLTDHILTGAVVTYDDFLPRFGGHLRKEVTKQGVVRAA